ncbi:phage terminase small subunit P27 family [Bacteroides neonati]|uniref:phage terminase small subunit P27 family n=1 Tax=Bacteroides neonati TaxID=1347393 RepID=UPI0004AF0305|nr:phage terminase small subunit P27 family [Bacteroides neonati]
MKKYTIPTNIESGAKRYMEGVLAGLEDTGILETVDTAALDILARNYSMFIKASSQLELEGMTITNQQGNLVAHPAIKISKDAQTQALKVMKEFGLTALARKKLPKMEKEKEEDSPFEQFIKQGKEVR